MKEQMQQRLTELKAEYEAGQKMLADLEAKQINLQQTLLRISGAIQVVEELLNDAPQATVGDLAPNVEPVIAGNGRHAD
jgi:predicted nuclease with TOPRIM domain